MPIGAGFRTTHAMLPKSFLGDFLAGSRRTDKLAFALAMAIDQRVKPTTLRVGLYLLARIDFQKIQRLSQHEIGSEIGVAANKVGSAIKDLKKLGYVGWNTSRQPHGYRLKPGPWKKES